MQKQIEMLKECDKNNCNAEKYYLCKYCHKEFCKNHIKPTIATTRKYIEYINPQKDYEKWRKYNEDWHNINSHPCAKYTQIWNKKHTKTKLLFGKKRLVAPAIPVILPRYDSEIRYRYHPNWVSEGENKKEKIKKEGILSRLKEKLMKKNNG